MPDGRVNNGGARPGAGRKSDDAKQRQQNTRDMVLDISEEIDPDSPIPGETRGKSLWRHLFSQAMRGDIIAANTIIPYIAGGKPREPIEVSGSVDFNLLADAWRKPWSPPVLPSPLSDAITAEVREITSSDDDVRLS